MKIAFTICSNNYLAQALTLGDSLINHNSDYKFYIGLVDRLSDTIDKKEIQHEIILVEDIGIKNFDDLWKKYNIIELNTCVKPMFFQYLINKHHDSDLFFYFDPDILVYNSFSKLEEEFEENYSILLTPHIFSPIPIDNKKPFENTFLNYGLYNLGFLGIKRNLVVLEFLEWWHTRTVEFGYSEVENGFFVDQLWCNLIPLFFKRVKILRNLGYNAGPWNLHERKISKLNNVFYINIEFQLSFYHFSNYKYTSPELIANLYDRYQMNDDIFLRELYQQYLGLISKNKVQIYSKLECYYVKARNENFKMIYQTKIRENKLELLKHYLRKITPPLLIRLYKVF